MITVAYEHILNGRNPAYAAWCDRAAQARDAMLAGPCPPPAYDPEFPPQVLKDFQEFLDAVFHEKCAFCERKNSTKVPLKVAHYRPRKKFSVKGDEGGTHDGYFWLCYEWHNLILACKECTEGVTNECPGIEKDFPVGGVRISKPSAPPERWKKELEQEDPLVLSPYDPEVSKHIAFKSSGLLIPLTEYGIQTIRVCGLNRKALREARQSVKERRHRALWRLLKRGPDQLTSEEFSAWLLALLSQLNKKAEAQEQKG